MKVFVIVVTYNGSKWVNPCFSSLMQSSIPLNILAIDNCSVDDTVLEVKRKFPKVEIVELGKNLGFGKANNIGLQIAVRNNADYIFLLNQDAWVKPDTIEKLIEVGKKNQDFYIISPIHLNGAESDYDLMFISNLTKQSHNANRNLIKGNYTSELIEVDFINAALWLLPVKAVSDIGGFDEIFTHYGEDNDYAKRVKYFGYKIGICPASKAVHCRNQSKISIFDIEHSKRRPRLVNYYLTHLKDLRQPLASSMLFVIYDISKRSAKSILKLDFRSMRVFVQVIFDLLNKIQSIYQSRNISRSGGYAFLTTK
jgi:GT2 family glycosyltransferase